MAHVSFFISFVKLIKIYLIEGKRLESQLNKCLRYDNNYFIVAHNVLNYNSELNSDSIKLTRKYDNSNFEFKCNAHLDVDKLNKTLLL